MHGVIPRVNFDEILNIAALPFEKLVPYLKFGNNLGLQGFRSPSWWMSEKKKEAYSSPFATVPESNFHTVNYF